MASLLQIGSSAPCRSNSGLLFYRQGGIHTFTLKYSHVLSHPCYKGKVVNGHRFGYGIVRKTLSHNSLQLGMAGSSDNGFSISATADDADEIEKESSSASKEKPLKQYAWSDTKKPRICVLGGGCGGLYAALRFESLIWPADKKPEVLIIDQSDRFVFKPLMYELLSKEVDLWEVAPLFKDLLAGTSIKFLKDKVKKVLPCNGGEMFAEGESSLVENVAGTVVLESGLRIECDWLLLALGGESKRDFVPGAVEYALPFSSLQDVLEVDRRLKDLERSKFAMKSLMNIVIVGGGYCGVELAATLAERLGGRGKVQVVDVSPDICPSAPAGNREAAYKVLSSRGVELILGFLASTIKRSTAEEKEYLLELMPANKTSRRSRLPAMTLTADLILWTVGSSPSIPRDVVCNGMNAIPLTGRGQVEVDDTLRVKGHPRIFAIGDSASFRDSAGKPLPPTAQVAFQQSDYVGWNVWAAINGRPLLPFRFQFLGEMLTLGKNDAAVTLSFLDGLTLEGPTGHSVRKVGYLYRLPTNEHRLKVGLSWLTKSAVDTVASVQDALARLVSSSSSS